jgi:hypothetical protein
MKELHAYQNDDGTYRVEVYGVKFTEQTLGKGEIKTITESKMEVPRAQINIVGLPPSDEDEGKYFTIMIGDDEI